MHTSPSEMNKSVELACAHSILLFAALLTAGWFVIAGWLPVVDPELDSQAVSNMFQQDRIRILIGVSIVGFAAPLWWVFAGAIATHMRRIEGTHYPLTRIQVACAGGTAVIILLEVWLVLAICFRPNIEPSAVQLANDFIWLTFVGFYPPGVLQNVVIGTCILTDKSETPIFPRWVGFANFWMALGFMPGIYIVFFKSGPFAWDGILGFWIIALCFFAWIGMMWWSVVRAVKQA